MIRLGAGGWILLAAAPAAAFDAAAAFAVRCSGCHSVGRGEVVGPDLRGVAERRDAHWLRSFIRSSQGMIEAGDETAAALFAKYRKRMPDHALSDAEIDAVVAFIAAGGPRDDPGGYRHAGTATPAEVARGWRLFRGALALRAGGAACVQCHEAGGVGGWRAGTLGSDLTSSYLKYRDAGLTRALAESRLPLMAEYRRRPLTPEEIFALKAFLHETARGSQRQAWLVQRGAVPPASRRASALARLTSWLVGGVVADPAD